MNSFDFNRAIRFELATQPDTKPKIEIFFGVLLGVILRTVYKVVVDAIQQHKPLDFGSLGTIIARIVVALIVTFFAFSGYWQKVKDQPSSMRFLNALVYGFSIDALVGPWTY